MFVCNYTCTGTCIYACTYKNLNLYLHKYLYVNLNLQFYWYMNCAFTVTCSCTSRMYINLCLYSRVFIRVQWEAELDLRETSNVITLALRNQAMWTFPKPFAFYFEYLAALLWIRVLGSKIVYCMNRIQDFC